jgi:hypothetical protein
MFRTSSVRLGGDDLLVPGSPSYDVFAEPDLDGNPFPNEYTDPLIELKKNSFAETTQNEYSLKLADMFLANSLNSLGNIKINRDNHAVTVSTTNPLQKELLAKIQTYPASYRGQITPEATAACHLIARKFQDTYNPKKREFTRQNFLENDYLGVLAHETSLGNGMVAFGPSWVLPATAEYIQKRYNYGIIRPGALREEVLNMNPRTSLTDEDYIAWRSDPDLLPAQFVDDDRDKENIDTDPKNKVFKLEQVNVYQFYDRGFLNDDGNLIPFYMLFAPINEDEMERILLYLNRNIQLYSFWHSIAIEDLPVATGLDFEYLFPVELKYVGNYTVISTQEISQSRLEHIYYLNEIPFSFPRLDDIRGTYATYLLSEALFYKFQLNWNRRSLNVGLAGWIQAQDIYEHFGFILNDVNRENMRFLKLQNYKEAVQYADQTNAKCFYYLGNYYAALNEDITIDKTLKPEMKPVDNPGLFEMLNPLRAVVIRQHRNDAKNYLASLGYDTAGLDNNEYYIDLKLGHRTYELENEMFTIYYYESTHDEEIQIHEIVGKNNPQIKKQLENLLQKGYFFDQHMKNTTKGYPGFIPSSSPLQRNLSNEPDVLWGQINR